MSQIMSITSQGQVTIPKSILAEFGLTGGGKATVSKVGDSIIVKPHLDFWSLGGSLKTNVTLSDKELDEARMKFETVWAGK